MCRKRKQTNVKLEDALAQAWDDSGMTVERWPDLNGVFGNAVHARLVQKDSVSRVNLDRARGKK